MKKNTDSIIIQRLLGAVQGLGGTADDIHFLTTYEGKELLSKIGEMIVSRTLPTVQSSSESSIGRYLTTVTVGVHSDADALCQQMLIGNRRISRNAANVLSRVVISPEKKIYDLWEVMNMELGFDSPVLWSVAYDRAGELGFQKCLSEVGLLCRMKCTDGHMRFVAMDPLTSPVDCSQFTFKIEGGDGGLWLDVQRVNRETAFRPNHVWLFMKEVEAINDNNQM